MVNRWHICTNMIICFGGSINGMLYKVHKWLMHRDMNWLPTPPPSKKGVGILLPMSPTSQVFNTVELVRLLFNSNNTAINENAQAELIVRVIVNKCPFFKGAYAPVKSTIKCLLIKKQLNNPPRRTHIFQWICVFSLN